MIFELEKTEDHVNETEDKKQLEQLNRDSQAEIKGGIPYEKPQLIILEATASCKTGIKCDDGQSGNDECGPGNVCGKGIDTIIEPIK